MSDRIPFDQIRDVSLSQAGRLLREWFPNGRVVGHEFKIGNIAGDRGESLSINLTTGKWADFAAGIHGGDLISVRAQMKHGGDRVAAAREMAPMLGIRMNGPDGGTKFTRPQQKRDKADDEWRPIVPPPDGAPKPAKRAFENYDHVYDYLDADGRLLFYIRRLEAMNGKPKQFHPLTYGVLNGQRGWHNRAPAAPRPLYGLDRLAAMPRATAIVCEGEKAVIAAQHMFPDYVCVTWPGGAKAVGHADWPPLRGQPAIIWPDNDAEGHKAATDVKRALPQARILQVADLPEGHDAADVNPEDPDEWLAERLVKEAPEREQDQPDQYSQFPPLLSLAAFMATFVSPDYVIDGIIQRGRLYALTSPTGHGKTAVVQYLGIYIAAGRNIGNIEVTQGPIIFLAGENPDDLCCRMYAACQFYGLDPAKVPLHVMAGNFPLTPEAAEELRGRIDARGLNPVGIIFDTAASFFPGDNDNDNVQKGAYARNLRVLTTCQGRPFVVTPSHPVKNPDRDNLVPSGGGAFMNELDGNLTLWGEPMGEIATMHWQGKFRGADFQPVSFALKQIKIEKLLDQRGRPIVSIVATLQTAAEAETAAKQVQGDEDTVLEWLRRHPGISERAIANNAGWVSDSGVPHGAKVHRLLKALQKDKLVKIHRRKWCLTEAGKQETKAE